MLLKQLRNWTTFQRLFYGNRLAPYSMGIKCNWRNVGVDNTSAYHVLGLCEHIDSSFISDVTYPCLRPWISEKSCHTRNASFVRLNYIIFETYRYLDLKL
jgi:hypothetical protein